MQQMDKPAAGLQLRLLGLGFFVLFSNRRGAAGENVAYGYRKFYFWGGTEF